MNDPVYPIHLHRRFEQRWAARFATATAAVKPAKLRKNATKAPRRQTTMTTPIVKKAG